MPAGRPKSIDNSKVFDVAKPGKSKPISTSRPVIVNHSMAVKDPSIVAGNDEPQAALVAPSVTRKVINPITVSGPEDEVKQPAESSIVVIKDEPEEKPVDTPTAPTVDKVAEEEQLVDATSKQLTSKASVTTVEPVASEEPKDDTNEPEEVKAEETADHAVEEPVDSVESLDAKSSSEPSQETAEIDTTEEPVKEPENSETASVDALAEASQKPKDDQKKLEEETKKDMELQALIDSRKYVVPLAHDSTKGSGHKNLAVIFLVLMLLSVGAYAAIDAKLIKTNLDLPYHLFKQ